MKKIIFNNISETDEVLENLQHLFSDYRLFREKHYSSLCIQNLQAFFPDSKVFLTHSATGALEMIALMLNLIPGDEIIMPSFTFVSTANAFVSHGATPVFIDIDKETLNINHTLVEQAITPKTRAIVAMHYAGHPCNIENLQKICKKHNLYLIEDAAMSFGCQHHQKYLGSFGDFGVISFDITKQISAVQGGLLIVNRPELMQRAGNIYHIGTNREAFIEKNVPYYEWVDTGSKFQMNELNAAYLYESLKKATTILNKRNILSKLYFEELQSENERGNLKMIGEKKLSVNFHEFYIILNTAEIRITLEQYLAQNGIEALFHYIPLHNSPMGKKIGIHTDCSHTELIAATLLRLPLHTQMKDSDVKYIANHIKAFFDGRA